MEIKKWLDPGKKQESLEVKEARNELYRKALERAKLFVKDIDPRLDVEISGVKEPRLHFRHDSWNLGVDNGWTLSLPGSADEKYLEKEFEDEVRGDYDMWMKRYRDGMVIKEKE